MWWKYFEKQKVHEYKIHNIKIHYDLTKYDENLPNI